jgi:hypothetical protein
MMNSSVIINTASSAIEAENQEHKIEGLRHQREPIHLKKFQS